MLIMETRAEYLQRALDTIDCEYGGPEAYLEQEMDVDGNKRALRRARLTVPFRGQKNSVMAVDSC